MIAVPVEGVTQQLDLKDGTRAIRRIESIDGDGLVSPLGVGEFMAAPIINFVWKF